MKTVKSGHMGKSRGGTMAGKGRQWSGDTVAGKEIGSPDTAAQSARGAVATFRPKWVVPSEAKPGDKDGFSTAVWTGSCH